MAGSSISGEIEFKCKQCDGAGRVSLGVGTYEGSIDTTVDITCPACDGAGYFSVQVEITS